MQKAYTIHSTQELADFADGLIETFSPDETGVLTIGLRGELGAGKTALVKEIAKKLGVKENLTSPTFVILKKYKIDQSMLGGKFSFLIHIDAYRLKNGGELTALGWQEMTSDPKNLIMIEWPELVTEVMPANTRYIDLKHVNETTREIIL